MKRLFCMMLALCALLTLLPVGASAQEVCNVASGWQADPLGGPVPDRQVSAPVMPRSTDYMTETQAVEYLRQQMEQRISPITFSYTTMQDVYDSGQDLMAKAVVHTGVPTQGDYLEWQSGAWSWNANYYDGAVKRVTITYEVVYYTSASQEARMDSRVDMLLNNLDLWDSSDYQKVKGIYDYICDNVTYDYDNLMNNSYKLKYTAYAALVQGTSVCQGYANLFYRLALELGVDARLVAGIGNEGPHSWNIVELNDQYYNLDATWDAGSVDYDWFLKSPGTFDDHERDEEFNTVAFHREYPMSATDYDPAVKIITQPTSASAVNGGTVKVTVKAQGDGLTYKWYYANKGQSKFTYTATFKGNTYTAQMNATRDGRRIYCVISDQYGNSVKSNVVTLTMNTPLAITTQPVSVTVAAGQTAKVTLKAQGDGLTYKWYYANKGQSKFTYTATFKGNTYTAQMNATRDGRRIYCVVTDKNGNSVRSNTVTLSMKTPLKITTQPVSVTVSAGQTAKVTIKAQGDGLTYAWYYADPTSGKFQKTNTFKGNTYTVTMNTARAGRIIYCVVTDRYGDSVTTSMAVLNQTSALKITRQPVSVAVAAGKTAKVTVGVSGQGLRYRWYYANAGSNTFTYTATFKGNTYTVPMNAARAGRRLYCVITDQSGNRMVTNVVTLNMT
ncbi:MAG: hypothetical protein IJV82_00370 [Oscillospiraceae bacterium]|nr:hypothetical protein [Oscillospiraceae bacterium]